MGGAPSTWVLAPSYLRGGGGEGPRVEYGGAPWCGRACPTFRPSGCATAMRPPRPADPPTEVPPEWLRLLAALPADGRLLAVGPPDTGKSTLCWWLAAELAKRGSAAVVDADIGQSRVGPPASVGWLKLGAPNSEFYFVGATNPARRPASHFRATLAACGGAAASGAAWSVIDTTGYLTGEDAVTLKREKIQRLRPVQVLAIGEHEDLERILVPFQDDSAVTIHHLPRPAAAREKPRADRSRWRVEGFREWLAGSNLRWIGREGRTFAHAPAPELFAGSPELASQLRGLLLGFSDQGRRGVCIGLLHSVDWHEGRILAHCPDDA